MNNLPARSLLIATATHNWLPTLSGLTTGAQGFLERSDVLHNFGCRIDDFFVGGFEGGLLCLSFFQLACWFEMCRTQRDKEGDCIEKQTWVRPYCQARAPYGKWVSLSSVRPALPPAFAVAYRFFGSRPQFSPHVRCLRSSP